MSCITSDIGLSVGTMLSSTTTSKSFAFTHFTSHSGGLLISRLSGVHAFVIATFMPSDTGSPLASAISAARFWSSV